MAWNPNDIAPLSLGDEFAAAPPEWDAGYWGLPLLAFNESEAGAVRHDASVSFSAVGTASFSAQRVAPAAVTDTGIGIVGVAGQRIQAAVIAFTGAGTAAFSAVRTLVSSIAFSVTGTFNAIATRIAGASLDQTGVGELDAQGERIHGAATEASGAGLFGAAVESGLSAAVSFAGTASFEAAATQVHSASVSFAGEAEVQVGSPPAPEVAAGGGGGVTEPARRREPRRIRPRILTASVEFHVAAHFAARAHVIPSVAEIPLPFLEAVPDPALPELAPFAIGQIEPLEWTDEEQLVALLMFEEAA